MTNGRHLGRGAALGGALCVFLGACAYEGHSLWTGSGGGTGTGSDGGSGTGSDGGPGTTGSDGGSGSCGKEGQACCSPGENCGTALFCQRLTPATATCEASPKTCDEVLTCADRCSENDTTCVEQCYQAAPTAAQQAFDAFWVCHDEYCFSVTGSDFDACLSESCPTVYQACLP